ncbi:purine-cytosine permease family protein [Mucisphaera calidilacus]|uniref:Cytosine permease n=1 Tax=Mucisphaera calidilacus TaxID=2527982 RepID=A0A518BWV4_9BACT|nr:hypothetical protein [Mucisphaera calidilacus]QDU71460.1 cytosine permease [Mucisphaera calidilacus]
MSTTTSKESAPVISEEYERQPVPASALKGPGKFWGMYAGEHAAGTEFMIGPLFLAWGVGAQDLILGLLLGNLMAVLSWRYLCAPIATSARMTLYYQLEKIAGVRLVTLYNLANGVLFCFLAGAMITVSATAVGIPFNMDMPAFGQLMPDSVLWVVIVAVVGIVISLIAAAGYDVVARFANAVAPWMVLVFLACIFLALPQLGVASLSEFWDAAGERIWVGKEDNRFTFWHIFFFAWFCNAAMHVGMSDLSVLRYAKKPSYGWASAAGMYIGHFMAWIAASLLYAVQLSEDPTNTAVLPGPMAWQAAGLAGVVCVIVAGWTTANPTIYRAGLAFQAIMPRQSRFVVTLIAGLVATVAGVFPAFAMRLLDFVGIYGTILAPIGAVIFADWYLSKRLGIQPFYADRQRVGINLAVLLAWAIPIGVSMYMIFGQGIFASFFPLPCWIATGLLFLLLSRVFNRGHVTNDEPAHAAADGDLPKE